LNTYSALAKPFCKHCRSSWLLYHTWLLLCWCSAGVWLLQVALEENSDAVTLANLMPKHWADFIRNSPMDEVKPIGTTPLRI
jgi:hypothetical protein